MCKVSFLHLFWDFSLKLRIQFKSGGNLRSAVSLLKKMIYLLYLYLYSFLPLCDSRHPTVVSFVLSPIKALAIPSELAWWQFQVPSHHVLDCSFIYLFCFSLWLSCSPTLRKLYVHAISHGTFREYKVPFTFASFVPVFRHTTGHLF